MHLYIVLDEHWSSNFLKSSTAAAHTTTWDTLFRGSTTVLVKNDISWHLFLKNI